MKKTDGFTLIELLVGILCATLITGAAMSLLLMGTCTNRSLLDANTEQQTARIITTMVDSLASKGDITKVYVENEDDKSLFDYGEYDWAIFGESSTPLLSYSYADQAIYSNEDTVLMDGVISSSLTLSRDTLDGCLFGFSIQTTDGHYETSTYCRASNIKAKGIVLDKDNVTAEDSSGILDRKPIDPDLENSSVANTSEARFEFLKVLCTQYGSNGRILTPYTGTYFSEWYLGTTYSSYNQGLSNPDKHWGPSTPWCACFLSWGAAQISDYLNSEPPRYAEVSDWQTSAIENWTSASGTYVPNAGDIIFFDWEDNWKNDPKNLDHIGVVFYADSQNVYTIEGNNSDHVELNRYKLDDSSIVGYGTLNWKTNDELNS